jgi:hypothetical protein
MERLLGRIVFTGFVAAILLTIPVLVSSDSPNLVGNLPPLYMSPYYTAGDTQQAGLHKLEKLLEQYEWLRPHYRRGSFDCSEMSAFLEAMLEVQGWHTYIACGPTPFDPGSRHAWLLVETSPGYYMPVETTIQSIVYRTESHFDEYFEYDHLFETIFDALGYEPTQFDWWNSL